MTHQQIINLKIIFAKLHIVLQSILVLVGGSSVALNPNGPNLGVATVTSGNNYPTSTYTFNDNDIINAGDINNVTTYTGIRNSTDTISLQGQIYNVSSTANNPPVASASGTLPTNRGGTSSTTYTYGIVVASGTQAFTTIVPGANGQILTSNGSTWTSSVLSSSTWNKQVITTSTTFTVPVGVNTIFISGIGPGGGGGSATSSAGGGGGSGSWITRFPTSTTPGQNISITIGLPGAGVAGLAGTAGQPTTVGSFLTLNGGNPGAIGAGGSAAGGAATSTILSGSILTGNSATGSSAGANTGGAGASIISGSWICLGGSGGSSGGGNGATSTVGFGCGGGGGGQNGGVFGLGSSGGPSIVILEY